MAEEIELRGEVLIGELVDRIPQRGDYLTNNAPREQAPPLDVLGAMVTESRAEYLRRHGVFEHGGMVAMYLYDDE